MRHRHLTSVVAVLVFGIGMSSAWALVVSDSATTARNAITAVLKSQVVDLVTAQYERLERIAARLSADRLRRYRTAGAPEWRAYDSPAAIAFVRALNDGYEADRAYEQVARQRAATGGGELAVVAPAARETLKRRLATLDFADSTITSAARQSGLLRRNGALEQRAIDQLEQDVLDPSPAQSATAVLEKASGAALIETRQKQARLQYLSAVLEQLLVDSKRARDAEAAALNMQLGKMRSMDPGEGGGLLFGTAEDLRTWRQP